MTANYLDRAMPLEAVDDKREGRRSSLLLPFPSRNKMARPSADRHEKLRILEALLFAAPEPLDQMDLAAHFTEGEDIAALLEELRGIYAARGVNLVRVAGKWAFRTADDLAFLLEREAVEQRRLSRAALETLAIIAYRQPVSRPEVDAVRGVNSEGVLDNLLDRRMVRIGGRKDSPGRPFLYETTREFLVAFGLRDLNDLPKVEGELIVPVEAAAAVGDESATDEERSDTGEVAAAADSPQQDPGTGGPGVAPGS